MAKCGAYHLDPQLPPSTCHPCSWVRFKKRDCFFSFFMSATMYDMRTLHGTAYVEASNHDPENINIAKGDRYKTDEEEARLRYARNISFRRNLINSEIISTQSHNRLVPNKVIGKKQWYYTTSRKNVNFLNQNFNIYLWLFKRPNNLTNIRTETMFFCSGKFDQCQVCHSISISRERVKNIRIGTWT